MRAHFRGYAKVTSTTTRTCVRTRACCFKHIIIPYTRVYTRGYGSTALHHTTPPQTSVNCSATRRPLSQFSHISLCEFSRACASHLAFPHDLHTPAHQYPPAVAVCSRGVHTGTATSGATSCPGHPPTTDRLQAAGHILQNAGCKPQTTEDRLPTTDRRWSTGRRLQTTDETADRTAGRTDQEIF